MAHIARGGSTYDKDVHCCTKTLVEQKGLFEIVGLLHLGAKSEYCHVSSVSEYNVGQG